MPRGLAHDIFRPTAALHAVEGKKKKTCIAFSPRTFFPLLSLAPTVLLVSLQAHDGYEGKSPGPYLREVDWRKEGLAWLPPRAGSSWGDVFQLCRDLVWLRRKGWLRRGSWLHGSTWRTNVRGATLCWKNTPTKTFACFLCDRAHFAAFLVASNALPT